MLRLVYETHSTSTDNEAGIATGWNHGRLSEAGEAQARELGERRRDPAPAAVFASDLQRAVQTATIAFGDARVPILLDWRLRECDYGELNGAPAAELERGSHIDTPFPGGESYRDVVERTRSFLADILRGWDGLYVVMIAHSANRWALDHLLRGARLEDLVVAPFEWQPGWKYELR